MGDILRVVLAAFSVCITAGVGTAVALEEILMNRHMVLPKRLERLITNCDMDAFSNGRSEARAWLESYGYEIYTIENSRGERLTGYLLRAKTKSEVYCFGIHGYHTTGRREFCSFAPYYLGRGMNVFLVDHTASGKSGGTYCTFGYRETQDCLQWLEFLQKTFGADIRVLLHGVSMGAAITDMLCGSGRLPGCVKMAVSDCGYSSGRELYAVKLKKMKKLSGFVDLTLRLRFGFGFDEINPIECVKKAVIPMLFIHGTKDTYVPCHMGYKVYEACAAPGKELLIIQGADHAQSWKDGREEYEKVLDQWIAAYLWDDGGKPVKASPKGYDQAAVLISG